MNKTQKLRATVEDITFETTFEKLPKQFHNLADKLHSDDSLLAVHECVVTGGDATLFIQLEYVGKKPKSKKVNKLFGYDAEEFMVKQYK